MHQAFESQNWYMAKNKMIQLNTIWKDHSIPVTLKIRLLQCLIWPVLMYECESWTIRKSEEDKIQATEMWFLLKLAQSQLER